MFRITADELPRFMACNGSRLLAASVPQENVDTTARDEGTAAHYMATTAFNNAFTVPEMVGRKAPNGVYMTEEMAEHVQEYLDKLTLTGFRNFASSAMEVPADHLNVSGRADYAAFTDDFNLMITDFKYGWRIVNPEMNWTLISHAIGIIDKTRNIPTSVTFAIFQPRPYHPDGAWRIWKIGYLELLDLRDRLYHALNNPSDQLHTSNHCNKCPALATCPAARLAEMNAIEATDIAHDDTMADADLSFALDTLNRAQDMIKSRLEALEELAKFRIKSGKVVDNYSVEMGLGKTRWLPYVTADMLQMLTGKDLAKRTLVTPAEAKRQGVNEEFVKTVTERPQTGVKLVRISADKKAKKLFGG
jgi:hypothetical protein